MTVGRYAPSPSGRMHLGNLCCCLLAWLSAKSRGGRVVLRIEDLDAARCTRTFADLLEADLAWLGLSADEGGSRGGPTPPITRASARRCTARPLTGWPGRGCCTPAFAPAASCTRPAPPTAATGR